MMIISAIGLVVLACLALFFYWAYAPTPKEPSLLSKVSRETILMGTEKRTYWKYVPTGFRKANMPLVIVLHGSGIDGAKIRTWTGYEFDQMADEFGFAVAYPDGYKHNWNDIRKNAPFPAKKKNVDDVGFIKSLIESYRLAHDIDPQQVYVFGYSNGGMMALRLAISEPGLLAGVATAGSNLPTPENLVAGFRSPMPPVLMVNGTADPIIPYEGGKVSFFGKDLGNVISASATAEAFAESHKGPQTIKTERLPHLNPGNPTTVESKVWLQDERKLVDLYTVHGGGHVVPQPIARFPRLMGKVNRDFSAPREAVAFWELGRR